MFYHVSHPILLSQCLQHLLKTLETTPDLYLDELRFELQQTYGVSVDTSTVWRALIRGGYTMKKVRFGAPILCVF
jgi:transposase